MNKASFDRFYKAVKGHLLDTIVVVDKTETHHDIVKVYWDEARNSIVIEIID
jgi:hypothetical protein